MIIDNFDISEAELNPYISFCLCNDIMFNQIPGKSYEPRVTRYHELELITGGDGTMMIDGENYRVKCGDVFYRPPGTKVTGTMPYGYIIITFDPYFSQDKIPQYKEGRMALGDMPTCESKVSEKTLNLPLHMNVGNYSFYKALFKKIFTVFREGNNILENKLRLLELIYELRKEYFKASRKMGDSLSEKTYYKKILYCSQIIDNVPEENYTLEYLSRQIGLSKNFMCGAFKEIIGTTIFSYIHMARVKKAKALLIETQSSIEEIAFSCGFENLSYFYRTFRKYSGVSPAGYRKHYRL